jgi:hypothetical protein
MRAGSMSRWGSAGFSGLDVQHVEAERHEHVGNQAAMALPPQHLGAHHGRPHTSAQS